MVNKYKSFCCSVVLPIIMVFISGCSVTYNTGGASVDYTVVKTASVQYFVNKAPLGNAKLSQLLTEKLKDKILSDTKLKLVSGIGDVNLEGSITGYDVKPMAVQGGNSVTAALNRLEVKVRMKYNNVKDNKFDYDTDFSRYKDYPSTMTINTAEDQYLEKEIVDKLVEDIFNRAFVNW